MIHRITAESASYIPTFLYCFFSLFCAASQVMAIENDQLLNEAKIRLREEWTNANTTQLDTKVSDAIITAVHRDLLRRGIILVNHIDSSELTFQAGISPGSSSPSFRVHDANFDALRNVTQFFIGQEENPRRHPLIVMVRHAREITEWRARRDIERGAKLSSEVLESSSSNSLDLLINPLQLTDVEGRIATRRIRAGEVITKNLLMLVPTIRAGSAVRLIRQQARYRTEMRVMSLENGTTGQKIRFRNPQTNRIDKALVNLRGELESGNE